MNMKKWLFGLCLVIALLLGLGQLELWIIPDVGAWLRRGPDTAFNTPSLAECARLALVDLPGTSVARAPANDSYVTLKTPLKLAVEIQRSALDPHFVYARTFGRSRWIIPIDRPSASSLNSMLASITDAIARRCH